MRSTLFPILALLLSCIVLFIGCEKTNDSKSFAGTVKKGTQQSNIKLGTVILDKYRFEYLSLSLINPKSPYPYGSIAFYHIPIEIANYTIEPKIMDSLTNAYILDSVSCVDYIKLDVDAIDGFFRLIPDHPVNDFRITEVDTIAGIIKGTFSLAFERDPFLTNPLLDSSELNEVAIFTDGNFNFTYKQ